MFEDTYTKQNSGHANTELQKRLLASVPDSTSQWKAY